MLIVTTDALPGYDVRGVLGEVFGAAVRPAAAGQGAAAFRMPGAGLTELRQQAVERLAAEARRAGGNAVVGMRFDNGQLAGGEHEVCAYGTAVWAEPVGEPASHRPERAHVPAPGHAGQPGQPPMVARNMTMGIRSPEGYR